MENQNIRVRIAPSPTGFLHVGTARTALFNYLFARKHNGKFILRIEDTDIERSQEKYTQNIYDSLKAMGLNWDEGPDIGGPYGPYKQSERFDVYKKYADKLIESGQAYLCWCTQEELESEKEKAQLEKKVYTYSEKCQSLTPEQIKCYEQEGRKPVVRFRVSPEHLEFDDIIRGKLEFDTGLIGDFVIMKSNGTPTYNFAVVIDDMEMKISHIIRGEDHISNTPRQILIYRALGANIPEFAHVAMILAPDRTKLSKRHGATAVSEFIDQGYLPEAFVNFLALLGWSPASGKEIMDLDELIQEFSLNRVSPSPAIFEFDKLNWMNGQYIRSLPISEMTERAKRYLKPYDLSMYTQEQLETMVAAVREPLTTLGDITDAVRYFFSDTVEIDPQVQNDVINIPESQRVLTEFYKITDSISYNNVDDIHNQLADFRKFMSDLKPKQVMWAIRAALTGTTKGADIAIIISLLGKDRVKLRVREALRAPSM
ncbi:MAG: glutamate--tRNA ligase [Candidatus Melainabacteria bacterium RIFOXYA12_FULL_32_12]|nr:MAG: glutamate--tRNA ligase [Candidatus Melainabacteria bacterium RIFOXYA2_FULL_32_9]OGI29342.1 MAG: glutamate--tRNA ligase [Candidatus Melainabacteria bacterium RIFOXYA12_FULL_32_12]